MAALKMQVRVEFGKIPDVMFQKSIMDMKKRVALMAMAGVEGLHFESRRQAVEE
jgi:hypothetical protein